jgi:hypothetical protein
LSLGAVVVRGGTINRRGEWQAIGGSRGLLLDNVSIVFNQHVWDPSTASSTNPWFVTEFMITTAVGVVGSVRILEQKTRW